WACRCGRPFAGAFACWVNAQLVEAPENFATACRSKVIKHCGSDNRTNFRQSRFHAGLDEPRLDFLDLIREFSVTFLAADLVGFMLGRTLARAGADFRTLGLRLSKVADVAQHLRVGQFVQRAVNLRELPGRLFANLGDSQRVKPA